MVYVFFAQGFEEVEALTSVDVLRRAEIPVTMVGISDEIVTGSHGIAVQMDAILSAHLNWEDAELFMLPGGMPGTKGLIASEKLGELLREAAQKNKPIAAICAAPTALAAHGVYPGSRVTHYPGYESELTAYQPVDTPVVVDGALITGRSIGSAAEFALVLVEYLRGQDMRLKIEKAMVFPK
jgi:4-methyl-5(b-hydroxyethyl)-thiazole monophosphate biosynthesis